jgi:enamine deaminase RidA (YjgF/YER057c/UK114 family)
VSALKSFFLSEAGERSFAFAQAVSDGTRLYVSGTLSIDDAFAPVAPGNMRGQLEHIYGRLRKTLEAHGTGFDSVIKETVFVTDMDAMLGANDVRVRTYGSHAPGCTVVEVKRLAFPPCMAEIELVAKLPDARR